MVKISIIIPIYNSEKYLKSCLDSVINQSYKDIEIVLINDGSKDGSLNICEEYKRNDKRIKIINNTNHGVSYTRNCGIKVSKGEYITFIDSDDIIDKDYIRDLVSSSDGVDLVMCGFNEIVDNDKGYFLEKIVLSNKNILTGNLKKDYKYLIKYFMPSWAKLFKLSIINKYNIKFPENLLISEDQVFNRNYIKYVKKYKFIDKCLYNYYKRENNSLSSKTDYKYWKSDLENVSLMKSFFYTEKIDDGEYILTDHAISMLQKYIFTTGNFFSDYKYFHKKYLELRNIVDFKCRDFKWKRRLFAICLEKNIIWPIYIYCFFKFKR